MDGGWKAEECRQAAEGLFAGGGSESAGSQVLVGLGLSENQK